jgi:N6-L-threonylcarbamoyladenine synthase
MLEIGFPAGEELSRLAGQSAAEDAARPSLKGACCSFSGLENRCAALVKEGRPPEYVARYCLNSVADAIAASALELKRLHGEPLGVVMAGGVMSSDVVRQRLRHLLDNPRFCRPAWLSADNAAGTAMLAARAHGGNQAEQK